MIRARRIFAALVAAFVFLGALTLATAPAQAAPQEDPPTAGQCAEGQFLATIAGATSCQPVPRERGPVNPGPTITLTPVEEEAPTCLFDARGWTCDAPYAGTPDVTERITGTNRYETAVLISQAFYPDGADTVFIASGDSMVDALPAGATSAGPVLLVANDRLPEVVAHELQRLSPSRVVILGPVDQGVQSAVIVFTQ